MISPRTIECERQNKPTYIAKDLARFGIDAGQVYECLLKRGVFKWFSVRRDLIRLKEKWKHRITESIERQRNLEGPSVNYERGYRAAVEECRAELRAACHSKRWAVPDNDQKAQHWFGYYTDMLKFNTKDNAKGTPNGKVQ